jgi:hypothetical protein
MWESSVHSIPLALAYGLIYLRRTRRHNYILATQSSAQAPSKTKPSYISDTGTGALIATASTPSHQRSYCSAEALSAPLILCVGESPHLTSP